MASIACHKPAIDYFSLTRQQSQEPSALTWSPSPLISYTSSTSFPSLLPSPISPSSSTYSLPAEEAGEDKAFDLGTFEDWMKWDDPSDAALSPMSTLSFFPERTNARTSQVMNAEMETQERLYSTPLSWTEPAPGPRRRLGHYTGVLSPAEELKLRGIAMPTSTFPTPPRSITNIPVSPSEPSSPEPSRKRKNAEDEDEERYGGDGEAPKKTAHNMIEKRYRTNLNDKIAALRDSVPSLRVVGRPAGHEREDEGEDLQGLRPARKLNKATILAKATEYIAHLEKRNRCLASDNTELMARVEAFEILVRAGGSGMM